MNTANRPLARIRKLRLWPVVCVALAILLMTPTTFAAQPLTGTFKGKVLGQFVRFTNIKNKVVTDWAGVLSLQLDQTTPGDGLGLLVPVFCIEVNVLVRGGDRYISDGPVTVLHGGCQIRYLLDRYPASSATTPEEAAARQLAIWHFSDDIDLTTVQEPAIQARAITLADEAALAVALGGCPGTQASVASLTLDPPTASVIAGQVVNYTVRADPPGAAQSVDISISGSATLQNGQQQATLPIIQGVATFSVVNPVVGSSTITARLPYALDAGIVFSPIDAGKITQRLVMGDRVSLSTSATVQSAWGPATDTPTAAQPTVVQPTETPSIGISPTAVIPVPVSPTVAMPPPGTPGQGPETTPEIPATPTHKPPDRPKPSPTPENTPVSTPPSGSSGPPAGGTSPGAPGTGVSPGNEVPGDSAGNDTPGGAQAGGANGGEVMRPIQLPNTGDTDTTASKVIAIAALLLACGIGLLRILRKRLA